MVAACGGLGEHVDSGAAAAAEYKQVEYSVCTAATALKPKPQTPNDTPLPVEADIVTQ